MGVGGGFGEVLIPSFFPTQSSGKIACLLPLLLVLVTCDAYLVISCLF